jgi:sugar/nucleoside kinase (ribokinase family)
MSKTTRRGFLTAGTWCMDRNLTVPFWPGEDMIVFVGGEQRTGGGPAHNLGGGMRRLDPSIPVETMGLVGTDEAGDFLVAAAARHGIGHSRLARTSDAPTMVTQAFLSKTTGRRTHVVHLGSNRLLAPEHFIFDGTQARIFHTGLPGIHDIMDAPYGSHANGWVEVLARAKAAGLRTSMELVAAPPEQIRALVRPCLPLLDMLVVNDYEIGAIADIETTAGGVTDRLACAEAAARVLAMGAMDFVAVHYVTGGNLVARDGTRLFMPSVRVPEDEIAGANGAGDAFATGMLYGVHEGWTFADSLRLAHAAAAASLTAPGPAEGIRPVAECLALAEKWGWRQGPVAS